MRLRYSENILKISLAISIFLLLVIASENYRQFQSYTKAQKSIIKSHEIQTQLQKLINQITDTETSHRIYVFTNEDSILQDYVQAKLKINSQINHLRRLTKEDPATKVKIDSIQSIINERILTLDANLNRENGIKNYAFYRQRIEASATLLRNIKNITNEISNKESYLLQERKNIGDKKYRINPLLLLLTVVFSLFIFVISFIMLYSYLRKMRKNIETLRIHNMIYEQAEKIAHTGHWYFQPGTNNIVFSNNLYRLLGFTPASFRPNLRKYLGAISESDRPKLIAELKRLKHKGKFNSIDIAIIDAEGNEKCLRFVARVVKDELGNDIVIGANKDLTEEIATNKKLSKLNDELILQNEIFKNAESIAMIGCYTYDFEKEKCEFSDNLYRILGHEPKSLEASRETLINFVHDDDKVEFIKSTALNRIEDNHTIHRFRIKDGKNKVKYILTNGKLFINDEHKILIVTLKDISEEVQISMRLEQNIEELSKSNAELESFNHIASHDLQEPLRKIQTFISILESKSDSHVPEVQTEYLNKINLAANRMRSLVHDLLSFSKTSKEDKVFEKSNLTTLLTHALKELKMDILEKNASIDYDVLPDAKVIPFQFQQLFGNLIGNSLKYARDGITPIITINNQEINQTDLIHFPILRGKELLKISFEDNGIGFDEQYADKIFNLFYRLHNKKKYHGTGIGLAICKKILQNHNGVIYAESNINEGTKFTIIFPKQPS